MQIFIKKRKRLKMPSIMLHLKSGIVISDSHSVQSSIKPNGVIEISQFSHEIMQGEYPVTLNQLRIKAGNVKALVCYTAVWSVYPVGVHVLFTPVEN